MKIEPRNTSEKEYSIILLILLLSPPLIMSQLNILNGELVYLIFVAFFYSVLFLFVNRDNLKKEEISFLENIAKFRIENERSELRRYLFILITLISQFFYLSFNQNKWLFLANSLLLIIVLGYFFYKYLKNKLFFVEKIFLTDTQFVFLGTRHYVVNKEDLYQIKISGNQLSIREKNGNLTIELKNLNNSKVAEFKNQLEKFINK